MVSYAEVRILIITIILSDERWKVIGDENKVYAKERGEGIIKSPWSCAILVHTAAFVCAFLDYDHYPAFVR